MTSFIFIYVRHELSYDKFYKDVERIYRIAQDIRTQTANRVFAPISPMVAPTLKSDYPQVENAARAMTTSSRLVRQEETFFYEDYFMYADQELFDIFTIPFIQGNSKEALTRPQTVVISERMALKYFGRANPLGKTLEINKREYEITGVVADPPENTHIKYDLIASLETLSNWSEMSNWYSTMFYTYLKLKPNVNVEKFSQQVSSLADKYVGKKLGSRGSAYQYFLQPISGIHLHSHLRYEIEPPGNVLYIYIFSFVGFFILIIACLNFMNLATSRAANRAKEVGMRKVVGAQRFQLIGQFLGESLLVAFLSLCFAMVIVRFTIPLLNNLTGTSFSFVDLLNPLVLISLIGWWNSGWIGCRPVSCVRAFCIQTCSHLKRDQECWLSKFRHANYACSCPVHHFCCSDYWDSDHVQAVQLHEKPTLRLRKGAETRSPFTGRDLHRKKL